ncbi:GvpL/GvpF family gas vesicle protein [Rhodococcus sp. SGAir0479]|uniref:GvpL/GvpF family gas vesicle protein n=1 Tax=Rhodococcus sp. SGAir0479 TaxID=2567884 RepID=UPI0010CD16D1|nr:GvpL/GvpF family gas vesicle protein [Rhodococcus sp. SGAir0479]QCQ91349.1 GvpL/GvpF family gas vesicle protein [Rhodococcus sp. SGAir0479]
MTPDDGVWVYAVTAGSPFPGGISGIRGVAGEELRTVDADGFTAVVGSVRLDAFGEDALRRNLEDLDWLAETARRHDAVVAAICAGGATVPLRLATVYYDDDRVRTMLRDNAEQLSEALEQITDRSEWGLRCYLELPRTEQPPSRPEGGRPSGTAYLMQRRAKAAARERAETVAARRADEIFAELSRLAVAGVRQPPSPPDLATRRSPEILNASFLVDNVRTHEFVSAVEGVDARLDDVETVLTGPWPPYSFTSVEAGAR